MATDILLNYNEATVTTTLNNTDVAGTSKSITISAVITTWAALSSIQQMRVMDKADLASTSGYEIMILTANNSGVAGTWTLTRGAESSTIKAHTANWTLIPAVTAGGLNSTFAPTLSVFGDGSDGTVTFDGSTTILGMVPSGNVYTLTRDILLAAGTINSGVLIITAGCRIFCTGTLTNNGTIKNDGANAVGSTAGGSSPTGTYGGPGRAGGAGTSASTAGGSVTGVGYGGAGGTGGASGANAGGTAALAAFSPYFLRQLVGLVTGFSWIGSFICGNGGGGGGNTTGTSGGGGGGGGPVVIIAYAIAGTGTLSSKGGNGAAASGTTSGGGGGGGGGAVIVLSPSVSGGAIAGQTITATGGTGAAGVGTGNTGLAGSTGTSILIAY